MNNGLTNLWVYALSVSGNIFPGGTNGGGVISVSTNNGESWFAANNGLTDDVVNALAVSGDNIYAGTSGLGALRSANNGLNWMVRIQICVLSKFYL